MFGVDLKTLLYDELLKSFIIIFLLLISHHLDFFLNLKYIFIKKFYKNLNKKQILQF